MIFATVGQHQEAIEYFQQAVQYDQYLAVSYFQEGVSNFMLENFEAAMTNFNTALLYLRGNSAIDYEQLGLKFKLFSCEVLFNRGLCFLEMGDNDKGMLDLQFACREKVNPEHDIVDEAYRDQGSGYTVFQIPPGTLYRPDEAKIRNIAVRDYLGKAKLIAATDENDVHTGFSGFERKMSLMGINNPPAPVTPPTIAQVQLSMPSSPYVLPLAQEKIERQRQRTLDQLDQDLERSSSVSSNSRSRFPTPKNSKTINRKISNAQFVPSVRGPSDSSSSLTSISRKASDASSRSGASSASSASSSYEPPDRSLLRTKPALSYEPPDRSLLQTKPARRGGISQPSKQSKRLPRVPSSYVEEYSDLVDDYFSDDEEVLIRCKIYVGEDTRLITVPSNIQLPDLRTKIREKTHLKSAKLKIRDEDGEMILLDDQEDLIAAFAQGGSIKIWVA